VIRYLKKHFPKPEMIRSFIKYLMGGAVNYSILFALVTIISRAFHTSDRVTFIVSLFFSYISWFFIQAKFIFNIRITLQIFLKYLLQIGILGLFAEAVFIGLEWLFEMENIYLKTFVSITVLIPIRFLVSKKLVFKNKTALETDSDLSLVSENSPEENATS